MDKWLYYASERQYADHLAPLWRVTGGDFHTSDKIRSHVARLGAGTDGRVRVGTPNKRNATRDVRTTTPVIVASHQDQWAVRPRPCVLMSHGAGQTYDGDESCRLSAHYSTQRRDNVVLTLGPNEEFCARWRTESQPAIVVGCPKLDRWHQTPTNPEGELEVAFGFHSDLHMCPETRWAYPTHSVAIPEVARSYKTIGHAHPRVWPQMEKEYERHGVEPVREFDEIMRRASLYVVDNSSTGVEFASLGRPIIWLNSPGYRRNVRHGGRFWDWLLAGAWCDGPGEVLPQVELIMDHLGGFDPYAVSRRAMCETTFTRLDGRATERAIRAIEGVLVT